MRYLSHITPELGFEMTSNNNNLQKKSAINITTLYGNVSGNCENILYDHNFAKSVFPEWSYLLLVSVLLCGFWGVQVLQLRKLHMFCDTSANHILRIFFYYLV